MCFFLTCKGRLKENIWPIGDAKTLKRDRLRKKLKDIW